jgi:radical SAM superfamily enzyme YgiQ (UPF0313 family)
MRAKQSILVTTAPTEALVDPNGLNGHPVNRTDTYQAWTQANAPKDQLHIGCPAAGLRFLKASVRQIDVLEYPTWNEYREALSRGYDIVGVSFFTCTLDTVRLMVKMAREAGVQKLWGGGYGVLTPGATELFDRVFIGSGEKPLFEWMEGSPLNSIRHPPMISELRFRSFASKVGYLYTKRGCNMKCSFCSTPVFLPREEPVPFDEILRVLDVYRDEGVANVVIYDETFMTNVQASLRVARALAERRLPWVCLTRADRIKDKLPQLADLYMDGAIIGIESFREANLQDISKRQDARSIESTIEEMVRLGLRTVGTYMLCHPNDTAESIRRDIQRLGSLGLFLAQVSILTPFPGTPLWTQLESRLIDRDWSHYDIYHLVWKHNHIRPDEARDLVALAQTTINRPSVYSRSLRPRHGYVGQVI